ncbi:hypothetical protein [Phaeodactylibacter sp.]|jgi:hypothetical protein|uniref:hypothetical protein n=1 Tax=Phaeodactylibacter sp. TaxID=1940289 RepID=UPI0025D88576|nr:hypothetical protein [Phaeodactylibacter sp.]MCI4647491.1 hypothetical protein [Phaeodactylibacter sp.]MCI5094669.1 hypothetical protein [Phaeodactylibacter sp.]
MVREDQIYINASCEEVYPFFERTEKHYLGWHQEHLQFEWRKGKGLGVFIFILTTLVATKSIDIKMVLQWHQKVMNIVLKADC